MCRRTPSSTTRGTLISYIIAAGLQTALCLQALTESCDLDALRREKRAIIQEERCLKALVDIEKSNGHRKAQMFAALRAEKQRHATKAEFRRKQFSEALEDYLEREAEALRQKHDVPPR